jgi:hypothetical protein
MDKIFIIDIKNEQSNLFNAVKSVPHDIQLVNILNINYISPDLAIELFNILHLDNHLIRLTVDTFVPLNFKNYIYDICFKFNSYDQMQSIKQISSNFNIVINLELDLRVLEYCDYLFDAHVTFIEILYSNSDLLFSKIAHDLKILINRYQTRLGLVNIPICVFYPCQGNIKFDDTVVFKKAPGCLKCKCNEGCFGIPKDYLEAHRAGLDIFPICDNRTDSDIQGISEFKNKMRTILDV